MKTTRLVLLAAALVTPGCHLLFGSPPSRVCWNELPSLPHRGPHVLPTVDMAGAAWGLARPGSAFVLSWRAGPTHPASPPLTQNMPVQLESPAPLEHPDALPLALPDAPTRWFGWQRRYSPAPHPLLEHLVDPPLAQDGEAYLLLAARTPLDPSDPTGTSYVRYVEGDALGMAGATAGVRLSDGDGALADALLAALTTPFSDAPATPSELRNDPRLEEQVLATVPWITDDRFAGLYRGKGEVRTEIEVVTSFLGFDVGSSTEELVLDILDASLSLQHTGAERPAFAGGLTGWLTVVPREVGRDCGPDVSVTVSGEVTARGVARLVLGVPLFPGADEVRPQRFGDATADRLLRPGATLGLWATLSPDGETLRLSGMGNELVLHKDGHTNARPTARITYPADGAVLAHGATHSFLAEVDDPQLTERDGDGDLRHPTFSDALRSLRWTYRPVGAAGKWIPFGQPVLFMAPGLEQRLLVRTDDLPRGTHAIRFEAVDHGGLAASDEIEVRVEGPPPDPPVILQPGRNPVCRGTRVFFQAQAYDPATYQPSLYDAQGQHVAGPRVLWTSDRETLQAAGQPLEGTATIGGFSVAGTHVLTCTAVGADGKRASSQVTIDVHDCPGNVPPLIRFVQPPVTLLGAEVASERGQPFTARVEVSDQEDADDQLALDWTLTALSTPSPEPDVTVEGVDLLEFGHLFPDDGRTSTDRYVLRATVRDSAGATASVTLDLVVRSPDRVVE